MHPRRVIDRLLRPHALIGLLAVLAAAVWLRSGWILITVPAGWLLGMAAMQIGLLAGARTAGVGIHRVILGVGPLLLERQGARGMLTLRAVPLLVRAQLLPPRSGIRSRLFAAGMVSALAAIMATAGAALAGWPGAALGAAGSLAAALWPERKATTTSTGWLLWRVPRLTERQQAEFADAADAEQIYRAIRSGDLEQAGNLHRRITAAADPEGEPSRSAVAAGVALAEAGGHYAAAVELAARLVTTGRPEPYEAASALAGLAGLAAVAVAAGEVEAGNGLEISRQAASDAESLGYPSERLMGAAAVREMLDGDPAAAVRMARFAAGSSDEPLDRADHLSTLAAAEMIRGDNPAARVALAEAEEIAAWWPRVRALRAQLSAAD